MFSLYRVNTFINVPVKFIVTYNYIRVLYKYNLPTPLPSSHSLELGVECIFLQSSIIECKFSVLYCQTGMIDLYTFNCHSFNFVNFHQSRSFFLNPFLFLPIKSNTRNNIVFSLVIESIQKG